LLRLRKAAERMSGMTNALAAASHGRCFSYLGAAAKFLGVEGFE
jgi:hypothetical protein